MEHISKNNSLETAKNRLDINGLTYIEGTKYVYDRFINTELSENLVKYIPLIKKDDGYVLRYKNLMRQYYWLINKFIPSCSYEKLCMRNGEKIWLQYENASEVFRKYLTFSFYDGNNLITAINVLLGNTASTFTPSKTGYDFIGWTTEDGGDVLFDFNTPIIEDTSVYAKYELKQYEIHFILNNGEADVVIFVNYNEMPYIAEPEKEGYTFIGWNPEIAPATKDTVYQAKYKQDIYIVRFFNIINPEHIIDYYNQQPINGGDEAEYTLVKTETRILHEQSEYYITKPTYEHFECIEDETDTWWIDRNGNTIPKSTFLDITQDIDVFPKLTKKLYTVTFLDWDNTTITSQTVEYLDDAVAPSDPSRENYTFIGWDKSYMSISDDTFIHALYTGDDIQVTYMLPDDGGVFTVFSSLTIPYNSTAPTIEAPKKESYPPETYGIFDGWYVNSAYTEPFDYTVLLHDDIEIYGKWKTEFEVTFCNWDGSIITGNTESGFTNPVYVGYGEDVSDEQLDMIIYYMENKPGYEFLGWNKPTTGITNDVKITAVFDDTEIFVIRFINSADGTVFSTMLAPYGSTIYPSDYPDTPPVPHMYFTNWNGDTSSIYQNTDVYAEYDYINVMVNFIDYNRNLLISQTVKYGQTGSTPLDITVPDLQVRMDLEHNPEILSTIHFNGTYCYVRDEFDTETGCTLPEEMVMTQDQTIFIAQYDVIETEITTCNVRFYNYDSAYWFTDTVLYGTVIDEEYTQNILDVFASQGQIPDLSAQTFYAWADEEGNEYTVGKNNLTVTRNMNLFARYKMISYTVQFYVQSNPDYYPDIIDLPIKSLETEVIKNMPVNRPDCSNVPERIYFQDFCYGMNNRWYTDTACTIEWKFKQDVQMQPVANPDLVTEDMILYGKYVGNVYNLTYETNGGTSISQETYRYPVQTKQPENPTKEGCTFMGWYTDNETFENNFIFGQPLTGDTTIYAKWFDVSEENVIIYTATDDLSLYMPDMGSAHLLKEECTWNSYTGDGILVYDAPIVTFNIGTLNEDNSVTVNTEIKRNLQTITIPSRVTDVVTGQFEDCRYLYAINVAEYNVGLYVSEDGVLRRLGVSYICYPQSKTGETFTIVEGGLAQSRIDELCFANCKNLKKVIINTSRTVTIEEKAFLNCDNLKEITITYTGDAPSVENNSFDGVDVENCKLYVPCRSYDSYAEHTVWGQFDIQCYGTVLYLDDDSSKFITDDILTLNIINDALGDYNKENIVGVVIGNNVLEIMDDTFCSCYNLTSLTMSDSVTSIGQYSFAGCSGLTSVSFGSGLSRIGYASFRECKGIVNLYIPYTLSNIGAYAFYENNHLQTITCDRITPPELGANAFDNTNNCPIYVHCEVVDDYKNATNWNDYSDRIRCNEEPSENYITFTAGPLYSGTIGLDHISSNQTLEYTTRTPDLINSWEEFTPSTEPIQLLSGEKLYVRGKLTGDNSNTNYTTFTITGNISVSGNLNSLWNYENLEQSLYDFCGHALFYNCKGLINASGLSLGTSATTLANHCYAGMFAGCSSLTTAPELPATELAQSCYVDMFNGCNNLIEAPDLPATALTERCYLYMFANCRSLNYIKCLAINGINQNNSTTNWVNRVQTNSGTFVKHPDATDWTTDGNGIPSNWTVIDNA